MKKIINTLLKFLFVTLFSTSALIGMSGETLISHGAKKKVFRTEDGKARVEYKLKFNIKARQRFDQEIFLLNLFKHKNIIGFFDSNDLKKEFFVEFGDLNLREFLNSRSFILLPQDDQLKIKLKILIDIISGIKFIHENGYVHRDIKPENIMIFLDEYNNYKIAKIIDFDLTILENEKKIMAGSPCYLAPWTIFSKKGAFRVNDIFSFGVLALEVIHSVRYASLLRYKCIRSIDDLEKFYTSLLSKDKSIFDSIAYFIKNIYGKDYEKINMLINDCLSFYPDYVPSIDYILKELTECLELLGESFGSTVSGSDSLEDVFAPAGSIEIEYSDRDLSQEDCERTKISSSYLSCDSASYDSDVEIFLMD